MLRLLSIILFVFVLLPVFAQDSNTAVSFTLGDRDRLMRNEQKIDALRTEMNVRFESMQKNIDERFKSVDNKIDERFKSVDNRIDDLKDRIGYNTTLLIFLLGAIMSLIGFVIYDRRTAIKPVQRKQDILEDILVNYSKEDKKLREILKNAGVL